MARTHQGRKKLEIKKIEKESRLSVTFAKRRTGLIKKASELCILCDAKIALIIFSPKEKVYSFGHPNVESIVDDYLHGNPVRFNFPRSVLETLRAAEIQTLIEELERIENLLKIEIKRMKMLDAKAKERRDKKNWWEGEIGELNVQEAEELANGMVALKTNVESEIRKQGFEPNNNNPSFGYNLPPANESIPYGVPIMGLPSGYGRPAMFLPPSGPGGAGPSGGAVVGGISNFQSWPNTNQGGPSGSGSGHQNFQNP